MAKRTAAASGEAVGDGEQGDVGGDRLGRPQVLVDAARRQRRLVDEETESQMVQRQALKVTGQPRLARSRAQSAATISAPSLSWPMKVT